MVLEHGNETEFALVISTGVVNAFAVSVVRVRIRARVGFRIRVTFGVRF